MRILICLLLLFFIEKASAQTITGTLSFCTGGNTVLIVTGAPGSPTYQWQISTDGGATWPDISGETGFFYVANLAASYRVVVSGIPTQPVVVVEIPNPVVPTAGSNSPLCSGNTLLLNSSTTTAGVTYSWSGPFGYSSAGPNPSRASASAGMSGTYTVSVTLNGCSSSTPINVTIFQTPATLITAPVFYCQNAVAVPLTVNPGTGYSVNWYTVSTGGTASAIAPTPVTTSIGTTTYYVSQTDPVSTCESARSPIAVNVRSLPVINGNSTNPTNCTISNGMITLTGLIANTSYTVNYEKDGSPVTFSLATNGSGVMDIAGLSPGSYTNLSVDLSGCLSNIIGPFILTNPPTPATPTAGSNGPVCSGNTLNLISNTTSTGVTYSWSGPAGFSSTLQNPTSANATTAMSGTYTVIATSNGCNSLPGTVDVVINQTPSVPTAVTPIDYCQNAVAVPLTATVSAGNTLNWYTVATGGTPNTAAPVPVTSIPGTTTYYVSQVTTLTNCESGRTPVTVNVKPVPVISGNLSNPTGCSLSNGSVTITGLANNTTYSVAYTKDAGAPTIVTLTSGNTGVITIANLPAGIYSNITATLNGCSSNVIGPFTLADPPTPATPVAGSNGPLCSGNTLNLTSNTTSTGVTYSWSGPVGFSSTLQNPSGVNATTAMSGTYTVIVTSNGCNSIAGTVNVIINQTPSVPAAVTPVDYCQNAVAAPLTATATAGNTLNWYTVAAGGTPNTAAPVPVTSIAGTTIYYVSQLTTLTNCESGRTAIIVNVKPVPVISGTSSNPTGCSLSNGSITLTGLTPNTNHSVAYTKDAGAPTIVTLTSGNTGVIIITNLPAGIYTNITASLIGCSSNVIGPFILADPPIPATPTAGSNGPLCSGSTLNLTSTSATPGVTYSWTGPGAYTSPAQNPVIINTTTAMSGTYSVTVTSNGCTSVAATIAVVINQTPVKPAAGSNTPLCAGSTLLLTSNTTTPGATYAWTGPNGFSSPVQNPSINNITTAGTGTYTVTASAANCASLSTNTNVVVNQTPVISSSSATDPVGCSAPNGSINLVGMIPNTSYTVQFIKNGGAPTILTLTSGGNGFITITNLSGGTYSNIFVTLNGCSSNPVGPFTLVNPVPPATPTAGSNSPLCSGGILDLTSNFVPGGAIYSWTGSGGFTSNQQNPVIPNATIAMSGAYNVTITTYGCTSAPATINVIINQAPGTPTAGSNSPLCDGSTLNLNSSAVAPGAAFSWTGPNGFASNLQNPAIPGVTPAATGTYSVMTTLGSCSSLITSIPVIINTTPNISGASSTDPVNCLSFEGTIILNGLAPNTFYDAQYTQNVGPPVMVTGLISDNNGVATLTNLTGGTYTNIGVTLNGCSSNIVGPFTVALSGPLPATPVAGANGPVCVGGALKLTAKAAVPGVTFGWTGPNGFISSLQNPVINNITTSANGKYFVNVTLDGCTSLSDSVTVLVADNPVVDLGPDLILPVGNQHVINPAVFNAPGAIYLWSPATNLSCSNCLAPTATIYNDIVYKLQVTNDFGCVSSDTINIKVICAGSNIHIPNAFTPNGDRLNDIFRIESPGAITIKYFRIYSMWGKLLFEKVSSTTNSEGWDGTFKGVQQPPGVYVYTAEVICESGSSFFYKGTVLLIR